MTNDLLLHAGRTVGDVQKELNQAYPFLKIEFYKANAKPVPERRLNRDTLLYTAGIFAEGVIQLNDLMTVGELENLFRLQYGLTVQVSRKSGPIWLETTMTDRWTLKQQNDHGRELSQESGVGSRG